MEKLDFEKIMSMIENTVCGICTFELEGKKLTPLYLNEGLFRMLGYSREVGMRYLKDVTASIIVEDLDVFWNGITNILKDDGPVEFEFRTVTPDGGLRWCLVRGNLYARKNKKYVIVGVVLDVTERKNVEAEMQLQAERFTALSEAEEETIIDYNAQTDVLILKRAKFGSFLRDEIMPRFVQTFDASVFLGEDGIRFMQVFQNLLKSPKRDTIDVQMIFFKDAFRWYRVNMTSMSGINGYVTRVVGRVKDINEEKIRALELEIKAERDALSNLYNKVASRELAEDILLKAEATKKIHALMVVDLDNFKDVNDLLGHAKGDEAIKKAAEILTSIFKGRDVVGRIGGDEFIVFLSEIQALENAETLASEICHSLDMVLQSVNTSVHVTSSIGIAVYPKDATTFEELFQKADKALYMVKANGKNGYRLYDQEAETTTYVSGRQKKKD